MDIDLQEEYRHIGLFYDAVAPFLDWPDALLFGVKGDVSGWSPAQHLFHILRSNGMMLKSIDLICQGHPATNNEGAPNRAGHFVLANGLVRGRAQAPASVAPPDEVSRDELRHSLARNREKYAQTEVLLPRIPEATGRLQHPLLGMLNASEWLRTVRLHAEHHLAIIRDIVGVVDVS